jgi:16S rRNA (guanine(966)-N(2))-methyltransferase RsmD
LRVTGGIYRGRKITACRGFKARPTTDFARAGLFNILANMICFEETSVLDLFAGTGSMSFEFASRGARELHLVEIDRLHIEGIRKMAGELRLNNLRIIHLDARTFLKTCTAKYDVIIADPPYNLPWLSEIPSIVLASGALSDKGLLVVEHPRHAAFSNHENFTGHRVYGNVNFSFFSKAAGTKAAPPPLFL